MGENLKTYLHLMNRFLRPCWRSVGLMLMLSITASSLFSIRFLVLAPVMETVVKNSMKPAQSLWDLSLNNLGPTILHIFSINAGDTSRILMVCVLLFVSIHSITAIFQIGSQVLIQTIRNFVRKELTVDLHRHLLSQSLGYFFSGNSGDFTSRLMNDVNITANSLDKIAKGLLYNLIQISLYVYILLKTNVFLTFSLLLLGLVHIIVARLISPLTYRKAKEAQKQIGSMNQSIFESFQNIRSIKSFAVERFDISRVKRAAENLRKVMVSSQIALYIHEPIRIFLDGIVIGAFIFISYRFISNGALVVSAYAIFIGLAMQLITPISAFSGTLVKLSSIMGGAARLEEVFNTQSTISDGVKSASDFYRELTIEGVTFGYLPNQPVLKDISMSLEKGEMLAIVGPSGAGKSTLIDLILRLYDPWEGRICYDGIDLKAFNQKSYRRRFGIVNQECILMNTAIRENISFGRGGDEQEVWRAAKAAKADEFIEKLPRGLDTHVGERGLCLSGGQRQRIAIARAIFGKPSILIMDEATSSLDSELEMSLQKSILSIIRKITAIVIAHRLSTVVNADRILVLNNGCIEAIGTHDELLTTNATYEKLYTYQFVRGAAFKK